MFAYMFTAKLQEPFETGNGPAELTVISMHYFDFVTARLIMLANDLAGFCLGRAVNLLLPVNNFITVSG